MNKPLDSVKVTGSRVLEGPKGSAQVFDLILISGQLINLLFDEV